MISTGHVCSLVSGYTATDVNDYSSVGNSANTQLVDAVVAEITRLCVPLANRLDKEVLHLIIFFSPSDDNPLC